MIGYSGASDQKVRTVGTATWTPCSASRGIPPETPWLREWARAARRDGVSGPTPEALRASVPFGFWVSCIKYRNLPFSLKEPWQAAHLSASGFNTEAAASTFHEFLSHPLAVVF